MKKIIGMLIIAAAFSGCKKDKDVQPSQPQQKKLVHAQYPEAPSSDIVYNYDEQGRVVWQETGTYKYSFVYAPGKCFYECFDKNQNRIFIHGDYTLNDSGLVAH